MICVLSNPGEIDQFWPLFQQALPIIKCAFSVIFETTPRKHEKDIMLLQKGNWNFKIMIYCFVVRKKTTYIDFVIKRIWSGNGPFAGKKLCRWKMLHHHKWDTCDYVFHFLYLLLVLGLLFSGIRNYLLENDQECPSCGTENVSPDSLVINKQLRQVRTRTWTELSFPSLAQAVCSIDSNGK